MSKRNKVKKASQKKNFLIILSCFLLIIIVFSIYTLSKDQSISNSKIYTIDLPTDNEISKNLWAEELEEENKQLNQRLNALEKNLNSYQEQMLKDKEMLSTEIKDFHNKNVILLHEKEDMKNEISILKEELIQALENTHDIQVCEEGNIANESHERGTVEKTSLEEIYDIDFVEEEILEERSLPLCEWNMENMEKGIEMQNVEEIIPAGTTVKALLVSTLDAPCGVNANSDPQPIKLRVLDNAHLPKNVQAKLKGCLIIGSAFGNLSSERVWVRAERITKIFSNGNFIETEVSGYITGEDGRYGVRGIVVDKTGKLLWRAGVAGFFSGLNQYLQATVNAQDISKATCGLPNDVKWDVLKNSSLQGASSSLDKLTEYYIKRAEQLLPVIQVGAGRIVDVTFTHNVRLGENNIKNKLKILRERSREKSDKNINASHDG